MEPFHLTRKSYHRQNPQLPLPKAPRFNHLGAFRYFEEQELMTFGPVLIQELGRCRVHIGECIFYYKNVYGGEASFKALLPKKQDFTGWLSPDGFLFACEFTFARPLFNGLNYGDAAREIRLGIGSESKGYQEDIESLRNHGWIFVAYGEPRQQRKPLRDIQVQVLKALKGVE